MSAHGTHTSYARGCHCEDCKIGHADYMRRYRRGVRADARRTGRRRGARLRALTRLAHLHPEDFERLLVAEREGVAGRKATRSKPRTEAAGPNTPKAARALAREAGS